METIIKKKKIKPISAGTKARAAFKKKKSETFDRSRIKPRGLAGILKATYSSTPEEVFNLY